VVALRGGACALWLGSRSARNNTSMVVEMRIGWISSAASDRPGQSGPRGDPPGAVGFSLTVRIIPLKTYFPQTIFT
jgi:hypothetical protein